MVLSQPSLLRFSSEFINWNNKSATWLTSPISSLTTGTTPLSLVKPWYDIFLAALWEQMNISPFTVSKPMYFISGRTQQFVCPNMVSGLRVAATKKIFFPFKPLRRKKYVFMRRKRWILLHLIFEKDEAITLWQTHLNLDGYGSRTFNLTKVYSWGPTP